MRAIPNAATAEAPLTGPSEHPIEDGDARVERFLERVATLSPAAWAELRAAGERVAGPGIGARIRRARGVAALVPPSMRALRLPAAGTAVAAELVRDVMGLLAGGPSGPAWRHRPSELPADATEARRRQRRQHQRLWDIAARSPDGPGPALICLGPALAALWVSGRVRSDAARRLYGPVQRVIPWESL